MSDKAKTLAGYVVPSMLTSVSIVLFSIVDGIFVGRGVSVDAVGAVNIAFPFIMVFNALVMLSTIGGLTITAIRFGRGDDEGANVSFMHSISFTALLSALVSAVGMLFTDPLARLMGANDDFLPMVHDYIFWYSVFILPCGLNTAALGFCRNDGAPKLASIATVVSTCFNIFGDWLCIFPLKMGLAGAAIATGVSQSLSLIIAVTYFARKKGKLRVCRFRFDISLFGKMLLRGMPECVAQFGTPVAVVLYNTTLVNGLGNAAVNAYGIIGYAASFAVGVFMGIAEGSQPLFGRSYGAKDAEGLAYYFRWSMIISVGGSIVMVLLTVLARVPLCRLFGADAETLEMTCAAMGPFCWGFIAQAVNVLISSYLYSTTRTNYSLIVNILRAFVVDTLVILLLPRLLGMGIIWHTFGIYESIVAVIAAALTVLADRHGAIGTAAE